MSNDNDLPMYRTFEEFEREEMRRADSIGGAVDALFDDMFAEELDLDSSSGRAARHEEVDDEE